jgi:hypothetical protein
MLPGAMRWRSVPAGRHGAPLRGMPPLDRVRPM